MTPEQMREAANNRVDEVATMFRAPSVASCVCDMISKAIRAIPITPPEPTIKVRIAQVIYGGPPDISNAWWQSSERMVGKVLETMREPTEAMIDAARRDYCVDRANILGIYRTMIDAALAEK